jgi:uncharacterized membrane protein YvbJ
MSYCPKCGNKVDETMMFCPKCGASLKVQAAPTQTATSQPYQYRNEKAEKNEKNQHNEKGEKQEKGEYGYLGWLIGGLVLIVLGVFSVLSFMRIVDSALMGAITLLAVGVVILVVAVVVSRTAKKRNPDTAVT